MGTSEVVEDKSMAEKSCGWSACRCQNTMDKWPRMAEDELTLDNTLDNIEGNIEEDVVEDTEWKIQWKIQSDRVENTVEIQCKMWTWMGERIMKAKHPNTTTAATHKMSSAQIWNSKDKQIFKFGLQELLSEQTNAPLVPIINDGYYKSTSQIDLSKLPFD